MTSAEDAADRLRRHMACEHRRPFDGLDWRLLQPAEQRMWLRRVEVVLNVTAAWRPPDDHDDLHVVL